LEGRRHCGSFDYTEGKPNGKIELDRRNKNPPIPKKNLETSNSEPRTITRKPEIKVKEGRSLYPERGKHIGGRGS